MVICKHRHGALVEAVDARDCDPVLIGRVAGDDAAVSAWTAFWRVFLLAALIALAL
ncbi:MAG: hypothetical protein OEL78_00130 [Hyphomicrobiales bacterium]|nr:hypothetical protein [Hyphomicrobiales bacterium]